MENIKSSRYKEEKEMPVVGILIVALGAAVDGLISLLDLLK